MSGPKAADTKTDGSRTYIYPPTGEKFPSVTTILSGTDGKRYLIDWSAKLAAERAVDEIEHVTRLLATGEGDRREAAGGRGLREGSREGSPRAQGRRRQLRA